MLSELFSILARGDANLTHIRIDTDLHTGRSHVMRDGRGGGSRSVIRVGCLCGSLYGEHH